MAQFNSLLVTGDSRFLNTINGKVREVGGYFGGTRQTSANLTGSANGGIRTFIASTTMTTAKPDGDANIIHCDWDSGTTWSSQLALLHGGGRLQHRGQTDSSGTWSQWYSVYSEAYKPSPSDIGASADNHTHATSIATSTGTSKITLAHGSKYALTAGGTSYIFTMPASGNTDRYVNSAEFADDSTATSASPVKMTLTRAGSDTNTVTANIPKVSSSSAGVVPKGAAVSSQTQSTKFLRNDGTWAAPSYTSVTSTYSSTGTTAVNGTAVASAIGGLNVTGASSIAASKTISEWSETNGKVSISTQDIAIANTQVSGLGTASTKNVPTSGNASTSQVVMGNDTRLSDSRTPKSHEHGNITNAGAVTTTVAIENGDSLLITDSSASSVVKATTITFNGSTATKCLTQKGTWESFTNNAGTVTSVKVGTTSYSPSSGVVSLPAYPTTLPASDTTSTYSSTGTAPVNGTAVASAIGTTKIATSTGTNQITLAASTKYAITAAGTSYVFTTPTDSDTKNTAGSTNTTSKIYLVGTTDQTTGTNSARTYSDVNVYTTNGTLTSAKTDTKAIIARTGTGTAGSTSETTPKYTPTQWKFNSGITVANGEVYFIKIPVAGGTYGVWCSLNNGTNYYPVAISSGKGRFTTHYSKNTVIAVTYESAGVCTCYPLSGGDTTSDVTGIFRVLNDYDANTNTYVTQTATNTTNANYEVLFSATADNTTRTEGARKTSKLRFNPSTASLYIGDYTYGAPFATPLTLTRTSGKWTAGYILASVNGGVVQVIIQVLGSGQAVAAGTDGFVGTVSGSYLPSRDVTLIGYTGSTLIMGWLTTEGALTIRANAATTIASGSGLYITGVYIS